MEAEKDLHDYEQSIAEKTKSVTDIERQLAAMQNDNTSVAIATKHGVTVSNALISSWQNGENAIASYGAVLTEQSSAFIGNIIGVQDYVYGLQAQANSAAGSLSYMFSTRADTLINELASSYSSESNLNAMTNTLQNSLANTLERGYNISSIENALSSIASGADSVASAANRAAQALASMGAAQVSGMSDNRKYAVVMNGKRQTSFFSSKYAKGGVIKKNKNNLYDSLVTVNGDVNDTKHFLSQMETVSKKCTNQILNGINTNFKYSRRR